GFNENFVATSLNGRELLGMGDNRGVEFDLYPNPSSDYVIISINSPLTYDYSVINVDGKLIKNGKITKQKNIDVSNLSNGVYIIRVNDENGNKQFRRFIVNK
ncbi:MAG: T9SS type A sorting domain-containing protein, partial [Flavobacteriales bacterium]